MTISRQDLVIIGKQLRRRKQQLREQIRAGMLHQDEPVNQLIIPKQIFNTSVDLESDKWMFNGFVVKIGDQLVVVDPGVSFFARFTAAGLSSLDVRALILTHWHTDHSGDLVMFIEKILRNKSQEIKLFLPKSGFASELPPYYREKLTQSKHIELNLLNESDSVSKFEFINHSQIEFVSLFHSISDTFGFKINLDGRLFGYVSDTGYAVEVKTDLGVYPPESVIGKFEQIIKRHDYIKDFYSNVHSAVVNINDLQYDRHSKYHLSGWDVWDLFKDSALTQLILQHIPLVNAEGEDSNYIYKLFFDDQSYKTILPHYLGRKVVL